MPLDINCDVCGELVTEPGALIFTPPEMGRRNRVEKYHVCVRCFDHHLYELIARAARHYSALDNDE